MNEEELDGLSEEERAALEEDEDIDTPDDDPDPDIDDDTPDDDPDDKPDGGDPPPEPDKDPEKPDGPGDPDEPPDEKPEGDDTPPDDEKPDEEEDISEEPPAAVTPEYPVIPKEEIDALKTALDEAKEKFDEGEIKHDEYQEARDKYKEALLTNKIYQGIDKTHTETAWKAEQAAFFRENRDYSKDVNESRYIAFATKVNAIIQSEEGQNMSNSQVLKAAKEAVDKDLGPVTKKEADEADKRERKKQEAIRNAKKKKGDRSKVDTDIGDLPAAEDSDTGDEFAYLDKLDGEAYEKEVAKLTPEQLKRYEDQ